MVNHRPAGWISQLTRFDPPAAFEAPADWNAAVRFLAHHGLAGIVAYNLTYRLPVQAAPATVRDVLLGYHQGTVNDNVFKLVTLKGTLKGLGDTPVILLDAASFADGLYPHIGFRPIPDLRLLVREEDLPAVATGVGREGFAPAEADEPDPDGPAAVLSNGQFYLKLYTHLLPTGGEEKLFGRGVRARAYGPSAWKLAAEDALLVHVLSLARRGFVAPLVELVDLRELVRGEAGPSSGPGASLDPGVVVERAAAVGAARALYAGIQLVRWYFPEVETRAQGLLPELGVTVRGLLDTAVVEPARDPERERRLRGLDRLVRHLIG